MADMEYRPAEEHDLEAICGLVRSAIAEMENNEIFQWDDVYPSKYDFLEDIKKGHLFVGVLDGDISVVFAVNKEYDAQYGNGSWKYPDSEYRVIHRLCVSPKHQHKGIAGKTLAHIEKALLKGGVEAIRLDVFCGNPFALSLYRDRGYEEVGAAEWRKGRFLLMEKHL